MPVRPNVVAHSSNVVAPAEAGCGSASVSDLSSGRVSAVGCSTVSGVRVMHQAVDKEKLISPNSSDEVCDVGALEDEDPQDAIDAVAADSEINKEELEHEEADSPIVAPDPGQPTQKEIDEHRVDHAQFRSWCEHCVKGRARGQPHKSCDSEKNAIPIFVFDYLFVLKGNVINRNEYVSMPESEREHVDIQILVAKCCKTRVVFAHAVKQTGVDEA